VRVCPAPSHPPLIPPADRRGAHRITASAAALVFDFGQSAIKRAFALYNGNELASLHVLPSLSAPATFSTGGDDPTLDQVRGLADQMVAVMSDTWRSVDILDRTLAAVLVASIASYTVDGQPLPRQGVSYSYLHRLSDNAARCLARQVSQRVGWSLDVALIHDGTAAARTYAGADRAAVIMLGTALGVGFVPLREALYPIAHNLAVRPWEGDR